MQRLFAVGKAQPLQRQPAAVEQRFQRVGGIAAAAQIAPQGLDQLLLGHPALMKYHQIFQKSPQQLGCAVPLG